MKTEKEISDQVDVISKKLLDAGEGADPNEWMTAAAMSVACLLQVTGADFTKAMLEFNRVAILAYEAAKIVDH